MVLDGFGLFEEASPGGCCGDLTHKQIAKGQRVLVQPKGVDSVDPFFGIFMSPN